jgi:hypothetical protein
MPIRSLMFVVNRFILLVRELRRSERGMALPTAIFAMVASLGLAGAAVMSSVDAQRGSNRDSDSKSAIAAADAGANVALLRLNRYASALTVTNPCLGVSSGTLVLTKSSADGWCPPISGTVGESTYVYRSTPATAAGTMAVVATGTNGTVSRRVAVTYKTTTVGSALSKEGLIGVDDVTIDPNGDARVGVGTNGVVTILNNGNVCGNVRTGIGKKPDWHNNSTQCPGYGSTEGNVTLPPVSSFIPPSIASENSNYRLVTCTSTKPTPIPAGCQTDTYTGSWGTNTPFNPSPTERVIETRNNSTITLSGGDYFICELFLGNNSHLVMGSKAKIRIFFDTPENCGLKSGAKQIDIGNGADIAATDYTSTYSSFDVPGLYLMGSTAIPTKLEFSNKGSSNEFILYAPNTDILIKNNATVTGVVAGKTIHLENAVVRQDPGFQAPQIGGATIFERQSYVECSGEVAAPPNASC